jgi:hypothetical protein
MLLMPKDRMIKDVNQFALASEVVGIEHVFKAFVILPCHHKYCPQFASTKRTY